MLFRVDITSTIYVEANDALSAEREALANTTQAQDANATTVAVEADDVPGFDAEASVVGYSGTVAQWFDREGES